MCHDSKITVLQEHLARAEKSLQSVTANRSLCELTKAGQVTKGVKYYEGQLQALYKLRRLLLPLAEGDSEQFTARIQSERDGYQALFNHYQAMEYPPSAWLAYYQGALDACDSLVSSCILH